MSEVAFSVFKPTNRKFYYVEWTVPRRKNRVRRSTGKTIEREAQRVAPKIIDQWFASRGREGDEAWGVFRTECEDRLLIGKRPDTRRMYAIVFNAIEKHLDVVSMSDLTSRAVGRLQAHWRKTKVSENSIRTYLIHLGKALKWAKSQGMIPEVPEIELPEKSAKAKGRPLSGEEFDRFLAAVPKVIKCESARQSWTRLIWGLWLSSLRITELLELTWDDPTGIRVDLEGDYPALIIPSENEKGKENRIIPIPPDCAALFSQTPPTERTGRVFKLVAQRKKETSPSNMQYVSAVLSRIGKEAKIVVGRYPAKGTVKYASAHDLRRSAGRRWARQVRNILDLQSLMRHKDIRTTRKYYAHEEAADLARVVSGFADSFAITPVEDATDDHAVTTSEKTA